VPNCVFDSRVVIRGPHDQKNIMDDVNEGLNLKTGPRNGHHVAGRQYARSSPNPDTRGSDIVLSRLGIPKSVYSFGAKAASREGRLLSVVVRSSFRIMFTPFLNCHCYVPAFHKKPLLLLDVA
jgi:hypothetical protein